MSIWLILAIVAQIINSIVALIDKFLVTSKKVPRPSLYVFYTGILVVFSFFVYFVDLFLGSWFSGLPSFSKVSIPGLSFLIESFWSAGLFLSALYFLFKSLTKADASDVFPVVGSVSAFFILFLSFLYFDQVLKPTFFFGFVFLSIGTLFVSHFRFKGNTFYFVLLSSVFYALHYVTIKKIFNEQGFDNGFFWYSLCIVISSFLLLFIKDIRKSLIRHRKSSNVKTADKIILLGKILAGIAGFMITKAIDLGNVTIVQSLGGLQYIFLFIFAILLGPKTNSDWGENVGSKDIFQKGVAMILILIGFILLFR